MGKFNPKGVLENNGDCGGKQTRYEGTESKFLCAVRTAQGEESFVAGESCSCLSQHT